MLRRKADWVVWEAPPEVALEVGLEDEGTMVLEVETWGVGVGGG